MAKNSDPDEEDDDDDDGDGKDGGGGVGGGASNDRGQRNPTVAGKKPGYGMKTKPTLAMMQEAIAGVEHGKDLKMVTGGLPDLGNL